ncbi:MAG: PIN domain-containing protein [Bacteroidota bacterium]
MTAQPIADTGFLYAYLNPDDAHHAWAVERFQEYSGFVTCEAVITELCHLCGKKLGDYIKPLNLLTSRAVRVPYVFGGDEARIDALMRQYEDRPMDFADACLVRMAELDPDKPVLTVDRDFFVYRRDRTKAIDVVHPSRDSL